MKQNTKTEKTTAVTTGAAPQTKRYDAAFKQAEQLCWTAREMKTSWLRSQHADWPEEKVRREVARIFSHART